MYVDYRGLNKRIVKYNFPLPVIEDCLEYLEGKWISSNRSGRKIGTTYIFCYSSRTWECLLD